MSWETKWFLAMAVPVALVLVGFALLGKSGLDFHHSFVGLIR